jgi:outer membrane protein assembly factor BamB
VFLGLVLLLVVAWPAARANPSAPFAKEVAFLTSDSTRSPTPWQAFDGSNLVFYDINGDGRIEIVGSNDNLRHYVIEPRLGRVVAEMQGTHTGGDSWLGRELGGPAVGDVFGDHHAEIAIDDGDSYLSLWRYESLGSSPKHFNMVKLWEDYVNAWLWDANFTKTHTYNTLDLPASEAHPFLADVDHNGRMTVFAQADNIATHVAYFANGTRRWYTDPAVDSNAGVMVADLHGDGRLEAIFASDGGPIYVQDPQTGKELWSYDLRCTGGAYAGNGANCDWTDVGSVTLSPTIVDLFHDGKKEICGGARGVVPESDPGWYGSALDIQRNVDRSHAKVFCLRDDGRLLWMERLPFGNPHIAMHAVPFDVNNDGVLDLIWVDWNTIGHHPGDWQTTTRGPNLFALDGRDGHVLWNRSFQSGWSNKDLSLVDVYGDGRQRLLAEELGPGGDGLSVTDPRTGLKIDWIPLHPGWEATRGPLVADLFGDGKTAIVVPVMRNATQASWCAQQRPDIACREGALEILSTGRRYSSAFNDSFTWSLPANAGWAMQNGAAGVPEPPPYTSAPPIPPDDTGSPRSHGLGFASTPASAAIVAVLAALVAVRRLR